MKRFFLLLCVICVLYGLSWAGNFGKSTEGKFSTVTFTHTADCDSARVYFGYPSSNLYYSLKLFPLPADNRKLRRDSLDLDSIGGHYGEVRYYEQGAGSVSGYVIGEWLHESDSILNAITAIADTTNAILDTLQAHAPHGDDWGSTCAGSGLRTVNIYVLNSADSSALQSFTVSIDDSSSQTFIGRQATDSDGLTTWGLDDDTYEVTFSAAGWSITSPMYLTVTADDDTAYYATQYSPTPPSATYCVVYAHTYKLTGAHSGCRLEASIPVEYGVVTSNTFLAVPYIVADTSEVDGKVELGLIRSTNLTSSAGLTPVKMYLQLFNPWGNPVADTLMEIPDQASKAIWVTP